jgi:gliding motility-associated-like protein
MKKLHLLFFTLLAASLFAQNPFFQKDITNFNRVKCNKMSPTNDGGCLLNGSVEEGKGLNGLYFPWMSKFDGNGNLKWSKKLTVSSGKLNRGGISSGIELKNGDFVFCCGGTYYNERIIFKMDKSFNILWSYKSGFFPVNTEFINVIELKNGNIAFGGSQITVLSPSGNLVWSKNYALSGAKEALLNRSLLETQNGDLVLGYIITDNLQPTKTKKIIKINGTDGNLIWEKDFDTTNPSNIDYFENTFEDDNGNLYSLLYSNFEAAIIKMSENGDLLWRKNYGLGLSFFSTSLSQKKDKTFLLQVLSNNVSCYFNIDQNGVITSQFQETLKYSFYIKTAQSADDNLISVINAGYKCGNIGGQTDNQLFLTKRKSNGQNRCTSPCDFKSQTQNFNLNTSVKKIKMDTLIPVLPFNKLVISDYVVKVSDETTNCTDTTFINRCEGDFYTLNNVAYKNDGVYTVKLTGYCDSLVLLKIKYKKNSQSKIDTTICEGKTITINQKKYDKAGVFTEKYKSKLGCDSLVIITLRYKGLSFSVPDSINLTEGESAAINIESPDFNNTYQWSPPDFLSCTDCVKNNTKHSESIVYTVKSTNNAGCEVSKNIVVSVFKKGKFFIPNVFSPNEDGINDNFTLLGNEGIKQLKTFELYDRWGNHIFSAKNISPNDSNLGWDGFIRGQKAQQGVYTYKIEIEFINGKTEIVSGDVMVEE